MIRKLFSVILCVTGFSPLMAQQHEQLWLDYQISYPFANKYLIEVTPSYQTVLSKENKWRSLGMSATFEYTLFTRMDLTLEVPFAYTLQKEGTESWEVSPLLGTRLHITQNRRIDTRLVLRYQQRYFKQIEDNDWDISNRTRIRGEAYVCINGPNLFTDNLWYTILDYEEFIVLDKQLDERFANRRRARTGIAYRLNYKHRFELTYTWQSSRNEIEGDFVSNDHVIQFKYKLYLNPKRDANTTPEN